MVGMSSCQHMLVVKHSCFPKYILFIKLFILDPFKYTSLQNELSKKVKKIPGLLFSFFRMIDIFCVSVVLTM